ncbi:glutamate racemase [Paenibacillus aurantius]|uniref:Glutamate racemase n=1 Tax=Paenibacillus aurantius TaxID=2918900 RepID=A0AA96RDG7_9BACL|nr:glutamate racemase [Paenibacillus aurantius]WNQ09807.1 glutamate racemase [Paenibacillus aurantius]
MHNAIAVLDSGVGGLTVVKEVLRQLPQEKVIYFGDTARTPYGPRSPEEVVLFTRQIVDYLTQFEPKMIVIACNTATAVALEDIRSRVEIPVVGVIAPGARAAIKHTRRGTVGVIGTEGTVKSRAYEYALKEISPQLEIVSLACPTFVPLVESGQFLSDHAKETVRITLEPIRRFPLDCLILGCTHYPFLTGAIREGMGPDVTLISSAEETAREISAILYHRGQLAKADRTPVHQFFCSGDPVMFKQIACAWLEKYMDASPVVWQVPTIV